ncbi:MBG domain-containing protein [Erythrobacter oryzae]|uniref:MBG domain-containing protein n=1 Tax=Erythrobacter oryzae TaxID=3019556 RepID=UPI002552B10A|nr:MBG domain-containing protein [Erythrobacter sp. COR-2]
MSQAQAKRTSLMTGCGSAALALGLILGPAPAAAQGIQADGSVVFGSASINTTPAGQTRVAVGSQTTVIDWTPFEDNNGNALDFLPTNAFAFYENNSNASFVSDFAVLNRILPATNGNVAVINGSVISRIVDFTGNATPGGFIAFYSPTGILVGSGASFDVGRLLLTTLDTTPENFRDFYQQGAQLQLRAATGSTARITIQPNAQISALRENGFFAVVAADVEMRGIARVNGSHAYIAGEAVNLTFSNGLFNIEIPTGTAAAGEVVTLDGNIGGPSSTGTGDNHLIYAVARASQDPISMLFRGNLGFDPAQSAGVINGEIILAANYDVFGRDVNGGSISNGVNGTFGGDAETSLVRADIAINDANVTGNLLAISSHAVSAAAVTADSTFSGDLLLVGRENSSLRALNGNDLTVNGSVLVDARDFGASGSFLQTIDQANAAAGNALIESIGGGTLRIGGSAQVRADAFAGANFGQGIAGSATGGNAAISAEGGVVDITGTVEISAAGIGTKSSSILTGADSRGGSAELRVRAGGSALLGSTLNVDASATAANGVLFSGSTLSNAFGGNARIAVNDGGGTVTVGGEAVLNATAIGGSANAAGTGSVGDAGEATVLIRQSGLVTINGNLTVRASGSGGANAGGTGGNGLGGRAAVLTEFGGTVNITGDFTAVASAFGGAGRTGGDGLAGLAGAQAQLGTIAIGGRADIDANGTGGNAEFDFGGNGGIGRGGNAFLQADGTLGADATITVAGEAFVVASGLGGVGGASDGSGIAAGTGGFGYGGDSLTPNQADPNFNGGVYVLAGGDRGTIEVGSLFAQSNGVGGTGGAGAGSFTGGTGGDGFGGLTQVGLALLGQNGTISLGRAGLGVVTAAASGFGGRSGRDGNDDVNGIGGNGTGGFAALTVRAGDVTATSISLVANGVGEEGATAGTGTGGTAAVLGGLGGALSTDELRLEANGFGGFSSVPGGTGGNGIGGLATIQIDDISIAIDGDVALDASGLGGNSADGAAGNGVGGEAFVGQAQSGTAGTLNITGHTEIFANGRGGDSFGDFAAGNGRGGRAVVSVIQGATASFGSVQLVAIGRGGSADAHEGGDGTGGQVELSASGTGSRITIADNVPARFASDSPGGSAILNASGFGADTSGGDGIGGGGVGGQISLGALDGGQLNLPFLPTGTLRFVARGIGGNSFADGGTGGIARGGSAFFDAQGAFTEINLGRARFDVGALGGSSGDPAVNVNGGSAVGGAIGIFVNNGALVRLENLTGQTGARGGDGSGTGNGGSARVGASVVRLTGSTLQVTGTLGFTDDTRGGSGFVGGDVSLGFGEGGPLSQSRFTAEDSFIDVFSFGQNQDGIIFESLATGGTGVQQGGNATSSPGVFSVQGSQMGGGFVRMSSIATGGDATGPNGVGGLARSGRIDIFTNPSTINLVGSSLFETVANGGDGTIGGDALAGDILADFNETSMFAGDELAFVSEASAGQGANVAGVSGVGNATAGAVDVQLTDSSIGGGRLSLEANAFAESFNPEVAGGSATAGRTLLRLSGASEANFTSLFLQSNALTSFGQRQEVIGVDQQGNPIIGTVFDFSGEAYGGFVRVVQDSDTVGGINVFDMRIEAGGSGGGFEVVGQYSIEVLGGELNADFLDAQAFGFSFGNGPSVSQVVVQDAAMLVENMNLFTRGDLDLVTIDGGIIGSNGATGTTNFMNVRADGTLSVRNTVSTAGGTNQLSSPSLQPFGAGLTNGGIGGATINMFAGGSLLLDGTIVSPDGSITLYANDFGGNFSGQPAVFSMSSGSLIDAGTGDVFIQLTNTGAATGDITLGDIIAGTINVRNQSNSDIRLRAGDRLTASGTLRAISLAALGGEVIDENTLVAANPTSGLVLTGGGHFGIFAATPTGSQIGNPATYQRRYNVQTEQNYNEADPGGNYAAFRITPFLTVLPNAATRFYGDANPAFTASILGFLPGDSIADLTGALQFLTGANATSPVGLYTLNAALGTLVSPQGYQFVFEPGVLSVTARPITITASDLSRVYGDANPALSFTVGGLGLVNGDQLGGALATTADIGSGVGSYAITQGTLTASSNYAVTFVGGQLTVTPRPITITANSFSRVYGNANPALTFVVGGQGLANNDQLTGALATTAGLTSGVGSYAITQGTLSAGANYAVTYNAGAITVTPRPITITADSFSRIYGNANPALTFSVGGQGLVNGDQLTGALAAAGVTAGVGTSAITLGTLSAGANYAVTFNAGVLTITPRPISITANDLSRFYGDANPALTFTVGGLGLVNGDQLTGSLATLAGLTTGVGTAAISLGTLTAGGNYAVTFNAGVLTITPRPLTVAADNLSKTLGFTDPQLTFRITEGDLVNGDLLTGTLVRDPGEAIASFLIRQGSLTAGANYTITYVPGTFTINPPPVSPDINNPTSFEPPLVIDDTPPTVTGASDERFGIDFPEQPEAPLISEDPLLDDPVSSGGDSAIYGDDDDDDDEEEGKAGAGAPTGGQ